jgi:hypothetical protein
MAKKKNNKVKNEVIDTKEVESQVENKVEKYVALSNIKEDNKMIKRGEPYEGKYAEKLLQLGVIKII